MECKYPPLLELEHVGDVKWIVVLGGGSNSDPELPVTHQLAGASMARLVEGMRLRRLLPRSKLVLSGGGAFDPVPNAKVMADAALAIGVDSQDFVLESDSKDTKDQARLIGEIVRKDRFILITSASHMPRSVALFEKLGMTPIPAPADYPGRKRQGISPGMFFPSAGGLAKAERVFYEYLGLAWARLRGQI